MKNSTIAAVSTALSPAGISIIRISGENAVGISEKVFQSKKPLSAMPGYTCAYGFVAEKNERIDEAVATVFRAPRSYTGEDVVEISCHGGVAVTRAVLRALFDAGAVSAEPGEFTKRAFLNGKLDLVEAEAVMDLISAKSKNAARAALSVKEGALSKKIGEIRSNLLSKAAHLNAWADYPEEDIPEVSADELENALESAKEKLLFLIRDFDNGKILRDGVDTVIIGKPNVGKSTLMNLLSGFDKSIVTSVAGTTRDVVEETVNLDGVMLNLSDTAGIRDTSDEIEKIGVDKARSRLSSAALVLCVFDASEPLSKEDREILLTLGDENAVAVINKTDLEKKLDEEAVREKVHNVVFLSSKTGEGLKDLTETVKRLCFSDGFDSGAAVLYNERQRTLSQKAKDSVQNALDALRAGMTYDAVTVSVEEAIAALSQLTGENVTDDVIDRVFHNFCVGK